MSISKQSRICYTKIYVSGTRWVSDLGIGAQANTLPYITYRMMFTDHLEKRQHPGSTTIDCGSADSYWIRTTTVDWFELFDNTMLLTENNGSEESPHSPCTKEPGWLTDGGVGDQLKIQETRPHHHHTQDLNKRKPTERWTKQHR